MANFVYCIYLVKFYGFNQAMTLVLLISSIILMNLAKLRSAFPPPYCCTKLLNLIEKILPCIRDNNTNDTKLGDPNDPEMEIQQNEKNTEKCHWAPFALALKYLIFIVYLVLYIFVLIGCLAC